MKTYYAHKAIDGRLQTVEDHLSGTAALAKEFATAFNAAEFGELVGQLHDIGKCTEAFQDRLNGGKRVDHSTAGAIECARIGQDMASMCVAGHHSGLPDKGIHVDSPGTPTLIGRLKLYLQQESKTTVDWHNPSLKARPEPDFSKEQFAYSMWGRMLYSCLVDADFLDTEAFMSNNKIVRGGYDSLSVLLKRLNDYLGKWGNPVSEINKMRNQILTDCIDSGNEKPGLFSLTVPTGGGKTISSLAFALNHAVLNGLSHVIYVVPYTSIIEQNAAVFKEILGTKNVLEHHSEAELIPSEDVEDYSSVSLATENWDIPVVVTTAVQFFESLFSNKASKCRKLHNICNSVVIFDEAQMIPSGHLRPCVATIGALVSHFGVSAVLCTATQPFVSDVLSKYAPLHSIREISKNVDKSFDLLKRVEYKQIGKTSLEELASELEQNKQVLCIVNTRKTAKLLYDLLNKEGCYHLSTLMYPKHRRETLDEVRKRLKEGEICRVISTSLIEAGVDVDFPIVYRELAGLDSIVQAAGRCNREGLRSYTESTVTIFQTEFKNPPLLEINIGATKEALNCNDDVGSVKSINDYFHSYRDLMGDNIDKTAAVKHLSEGISGCMLPYRTVAESFHMIDQATKTVYIPCEDNSVLVDAVKDNCADRATYRELGKYAVALYDKDYQELIESGDVEEYSSGDAFLVNKNLYNPDTGLSLKAEFGKATFV